MEASACGIWFTHTFEYQNLQNAINLYNLWADSADDMLMIFVWIFPKKQDLKVHANCLQGNLHEMSKPVFWGK